MRSWLDRIKEPSCRESDVHYHVEEEQSHLFHTFEGGSCEIEYLSLINAIVQVAKPALALETGTLHGFSALAIADALERNERGKLISIDVADQGLARQRLQAAGLAQRVEWVQSESREYLRAYAGLPFGFALLDSSVSDGTRIGEAEILLSRRLVQGYIVLHDTSRYRAGYEPADEVQRYQVGLNHLAQQSAGQVRFPFSQGLTLLQVS
jgi:predicted O-methyltransferase YrrM